MIRFCDNEVYFVYSEDLDRNEILRYFLQDHMDEIVCVIDEKQNYKGMITYYSLINTESVLLALQEEYVIFDLDIWKNAKSFFMQYKRYLNEFVLLPVVDKNGQLLCFAYEDEDANREIRILRELTEKVDALHFKDIYPEYDYVKIYGFNELAFSFAEYLKNQGILTQVIGEFWGDMFENVNFADKDYRFMTIYSEGIGVKKLKKRESILESVSAEFECIDRIYEINVKNGIFKDTCVWGGREFIEYLKNKKEIMILGSGREVQDVYNYLIEYDIDICCFVDENYGERSHRLFGKEILCRQDVINRYKNPVFIECFSKHSSWGGGGVDYYDYIGYRRNERFYLIRDYLDISGNSLLNILKSRNVVLLGDIDLCVYLSEFFAKNMISVAGYLDVFNQREKQGGLSEVYPENIRDNTICLIALAEYFEGMQKQVQEERRKQIMKFLKDNALDNYTEYFSYTSSVIDIEKKRSLRYTIKELTPKRIVLGSIEANSGNTFFRGLLDGHPSIMMINYINLNHHLFWICVRLSMRSSNEILAYFWEIYTKESTLIGIRDVDVFNEKMEQLLKIEQRFTSQELFVIIHIAYMYANGKNIMQEDIKNTIIYWEPHFISRIEEEKFVQWLGAENLSCDIINVVRNIV